MNKTLKNTCLTFLGLLPLSAWACSGFMPPNDLQIPVSDKTTGLSRERYDAVIDKFESLMGPVAQRWGAELKIDRDWESPRVNAGTYRDENGKHWHISLYGGFARHPEITEDGYLLVICHEIGHHIGGAPKKLSTQTAKWSSNEGQADYYATLKCLRTFFEAEDNEGPLAKLSIPEEVRRACEESFSKREDRNICMRTSMAGLSVAMVMADGRRTSLPSFETPDRYEIGETMEAHPNVQCRLDTYFQGSLCTVNHSYPVSQVNEVKGTCHPRLGYGIGSRPLCWHKPK